MSTGLAVGLVPLMDTNAHTPADRDQTSSATPGRHGDFLSPSSAPVSPAKPANDIAGCTAWPPWNATPRSCSTWAGTDEAVAALRRLADAHPLQEKFAALLMDALRAAGRSLRS